MNNRKHKRQRSKFGTIVLVLILIALVVIPITRLILYRVQQNRPTVMGQVLHAAGVKGESEGFDVYHPRLLVQYEVDEITYQGEVRLEEAYDSLMHLINTYKDTKMEIYYLPEDPSQIYVLGDHNLNDVCMLFIFGPVILFILLSSYIPGLEKYSKGRGQGSWDLSISDGDGGGAGD